jgi:hypothetical protein
VSRRCIAFQIAPLAAAVLASASCDRAPTGPTVASSGPTVASYSTLTDPADFCRVPRFDPSNFPNPTRIDNKWLPLIPGRELVLKGEVVEEGEARSRRVLFTVTGVTKVIHGVRTVVVLDRDLAEEQLIERELAFFAQDKHGNVWNFGEYPQEFEEGEFIGAPNTWIAGLVGAEAGIHMFGTPRPGDPRYLQGSAPDIDFLDCAKVLRIRPKTCTRLKCYENVLVTDETSPLDPGGGHQRKFHAPGVGIVKVTAVDDPEPETLELVKQRRLSPEGLAAVNERALRIDRFGRRTSELYGRTRPAEP